MVLVSGVSSEFFASGGVDADGVEEPGGGAGLRGDAGERAEGQSDERHSAATLPIDRNNLQLSPPRAMQDP